MATPGGNPEKVSEVLAAALDLPLDERVRFISETCGDDLACRDVVMALLAQRQKSESTQSLARAAPEPAVAPATLDLVPASLAAEGRDPPRERDESTRDLRESREDTRFRAQRRVFGDYELYEPPIGRGGMGIVYKAYQVSLKRTVALKMILDGEFAEAEDIQRFQAEAEAAGRLDHPGIVRVFHVGEAEGRHFFSMAFVDGQSLAHVLAGGPLPPATAAELLFMVAKAIGYAHRQGIIHRDLKPGNILLDSKGEPRVTDFGLAKRLDAGRELTSTGQVLGTPSYMSPEQACGRPARAGADIYSLGAVLYCALTGRPPFQADNPYDTIRQVLNDEPASPRLLNRRVPIDLEQICLKCLAKDPLDRYRTADELAEDLDRFTRGEPVLARPIGWLGRSWRWAKRNRPVAAWAAAAAVISLAAMLVGGVAWHFAQTAQTTGREAATSKAIVSLHARLEEQLDASVWSAENLRALDAVVNELRTLDQAEGDKARRQVESALAEAIQQFVRSTSLADADLRDRIERLLQILGVRDRALADTLEKEYRERLGRQQNVLHLSAMRGDPGQVFLDTPVRVEEDALVRDAASPDASVTLVSTTEPTRGDVTLEVEFGEGWDAGVEVGLAFGEKGYRFLLRAAQPQTTSLAQARASRDRAHLVIARGSETLRQAEVSASLLGQDRLRLVATRRGQLLKLTINETTTIQIYDFFAMPAADSGNFGVIWPPQARVRLLLASRQIQPPAASPMEQGDALYAAAAFSEALVYYQEQANVLGDSPEVSEARYKQGLCLMALGRNAEGAATLRPVADQRSGLFSVAASCQLVRLLLRENQFDEADRHIERLLIDSAAVASDQGQLSLASLMPLDVRNSVLGHYGSQGGASYWRHDPQRVAKQERALALSEQLEDIYRGWTQFRLIRAYRFDYNENAAIAAAKNFLSEYWEDGVLIADEIGYTQIITAELSWMLRLQGKTDAAVAELNRALLDDTGRTRPTMSALLLERARVFAQRERWQDAQRDLDEFLTLTEKESLHSLHRTEARLMLGFTRRRLGHTDAEDVWKQATQRPERDAAAETLEFAGGLDVINVLIASSLAGDFSNSQVDEFAANTLARQLGMDPIRFRLASTAASFAGIHVFYLRDMWRTERGLDYAARWAFHQLPFEEHFRLPAQLLTYHLIQETAFRGAPSAAQDELAWQTAGKVTAAAPRGELPLSMSLLVDAAKVWSGAGDWSSFARHLEFDPLLRAQAAYILGERYRQIGKTEAADALIKAAHEDAAADDSLKKVIGDSLQQREANE